MMEAGGVASADEPAVPSSLPATRGSSLPPPPSTGPAPRSRRLIAITGGVLVVALIGALLFLYGQATGDENDAQEALALIRGELDDVNGRLTASEMAASELDDEVSDLNDQLSERDADLDGLEADMDRVEADLALAEADRDMANEAVRRFLATSIELGIGVDQEDGVCMAEALLESGGMEVVGLLLDLSASTLDNGTADAAALDLAFLRAQDECGVSLARAPGFGYGDNPVLDAMQDRCEAGDGAGCDELYFASTVGTDYEAFGATCGGRFEPDLVPPFRFGNI
jgi:hypothetical protein